MKKIGFWELIAYDVDDKKIFLSNILPSGLAQQIDDWITELESEEE